jgi:type VI protein secretion system component Hcp
VERTRPGASDDCFLRVDGVTGNSADARHRDEIELVGWSLAIVTVTGSDFDF